MRQLGLFGKTAKAALVVTLLFFTSGVAPVKPDTGLVANGIE